ncbi:MAG: hypothetical protein K940chlam5_00492 [Candidatus Anoxychlamydiales bacterium]|nr:hypothetical protein [Candidatus Anoxychlamydiales bacterium]
MILKVKIIPKSKINQIIGFEEDTLKIRIKASPEKGKANKELIRFIAKSLHIAQSRISIISGHTSRLKKLQIEGISKKDLTQVIVNK